MIGAFDWDADLPAERRDEMIEAIAHQILKRGLATPAILLLETHRPLSNIASQAMILASGILAPIFGPRNLQQAAKLLQDRANITRLMDRLGEMTDEPRERHGTGAAVGVQHRDNHGDTAGPPP